MRHRERGEPVTGEVSLDVARRVKERHCYICSDIAKEFAKHEAHPKKFVQSYSGVNPRTGAQFSVDIGYERFLGPEVFFNPQMYSSEYITPVPQVQ